jgi:hypothetical protein
VTYRTGNHWGVTIVRDIDSTEPCGHSGPEDPGHDLCAQLVAVVVNGDQTLAERICALLNQADGVWTTLPITDSCTCTVQQPDQACPVHQGRRPRGPKPPPLGPGCICDGSGRTCPRHGAVL